MSLFLPDKVKLVKQADNLLLPIHINIGNNSEKRTYIKFVTSLWVFAQHIEQSHFIEPKATLQLEIKFSEVNYINSVEWLIFKCSESQLQLHLPNQRQTFIIKLEKPQETIINAQIHECRKQQLMLLVQEGKQAQEAQKYKLAKQILQKALRMNRKSRDAIRGMFIALLGADQVSKAAQLIELISFIQKDNCNLERAILLLFLLERTKPKQDQRARNQFLIFCRRHIYGRDMEQWTKVLPMVNQMLPSLEKINNFHTEYLIDLCRRSSLMEILPKKLQNASLSIEKTKKIFSGIINKLQCQPNASQGPPEEVIDIISYQIIVNPQLLPRGESLSGHLVQEMHQKGILRDIFVDQAVKIEQIVPNNMLAKYIETHPKLNQWRHFETKYIKSWPKK